MNYPTRASSFGSISGDVTATRIFLIPSRPIAVQKLDFHSDGCVSCGDAVQVRLSDLFSSGLSTS